MDDVRALRHHTPYYQQNKHYFFHLLLMSTKSLVRQLAILGITFGLALYGGFRYYRKFSKVSGLEPRGCWIATLSLRLLKN